MTPEKVYLVSDEYKRGVEYNLYSDLEEAIEYAKESAATYYDDQGCEVGKPMGDYKFMEYGDEPRWCVSVIEIPIKYK